MKRIFTEKFCPFRISLLLRVRARKNAEFYFETRLKTYMGGIFLTFRVKA